MAQPHEQRGLALDSLVNKLSLTVGIGTLVGASLISVADRRWINAAAYGFFALAICGLLTIRLLKRPPTPPPPTHTFVPFTDLTSETTWPRPTDVKAISRLLSRRRTTIPVVIGASGTGKSMLMRVLLPEAMAKSGRRRTTKYIFSYEDLYERAERARQELNPASTVLIFDQFERWLSRLVRLAADERTAEQERMRHLLTRSLQPGEPQILLSLRKEWYYDLRFLGTLVPPLTECCHITGARPMEDQDSMMMAIRSRLQTVLGDPATADGVLKRLGTTGTLLPLEVQIVGASLEREVAKQRRVTLDYLDSDLGGIAGAIDRYFEGSLQGAPNRLIALELLCALSTRTKFRQQERLDVIFDRLYEDRKAIQSAVTYLEAQNLITRHPGGHCELVHDYLAEYFNSKSGAELNPVTRDNILFHLQAETLENSSALKPSAPSDRPSRLGKLIVYPLLLLMGVRLLHFGMDWTLLGDLPPRLLRKNFMDAAYMPILVPHAVWIIYIAVFYDRFLSRLNESRAGQILSVFTVVNLIGCVLVGIFVPYCWLVSIGWGGTVLGLKLISLGRRKDLNRAAAERLSVFGIVTLCNLIFLLGIGVIIMYLSFTLVDNVEAATKWLLINLFFSVMMTYACWALARVHVYPPAISQILGLVGRARTAVIPRVEG